MPYKYDSRSKPRHPGQTKAEVRSSAGAEHRGLHALRLSFASNLYAPGVEVKIIPMLLGHASVEIPCNRYIHFFEGDIDDTLRQAVGA